MALKCPVWVNKVLSRTVLWKQPHLLWTDGQITLNCPQQQSQSGASGPPKCPLKHPPSLFCVLKCPPKGWRKYRMLLFTPAILEDSEYVASDRWLVCVCVCWMLSARQLTFASHAHSVGTFRLCALQQTDVTESERHGNSRQIMGGGR